MSTIIVTFIISSVLGLLCLAALEYSLTRWVQPRRYWFHFNSVEAEKPIYRVGEPIRFISNAEYYRRGDYYFSDILETQEEDGTWSYYSHYKSERLNRDINMKRSGKWMYHGAIPGEPCKCRLVSTTQVPVGYGLIKKQTTLSCPFEIK